MIFSTFSDFQNNSLQYYYRLNFWETSFFSKFQSKGKTALELSLPAPEFYYKSAKQSSFYGKFYTLGLLEKLLSCPRQPLFHIYLLHSLYNSELYPTLFKPIFIIVHSLNNQHPFYFFFLINKSMRVHGGEKYRDFVMWGALVVKMLHW